MPVSPKRLSQEGPGTRAGRLVKSLPVDHGGYGVGCTAMVGLGWHWAARHEDKSDVSK